MHKGVAALVGVIILFLLVVGVAAIYESSSTDRSYEDEQKTQQPVMIINKYNDYGPDQLAQQQPKRAETYGESSSSTTSSTSYTNVYTSSYFPSYGYGYRNYRSYYPSYGYGYRNYRSYGYGHGYGYRAGHYGSRHPGLGVGYNRYIWN